jgi:hypothetical protein
LVIYCVDPGKDGPPTDPHERGPIKPNKEPTRAHCSVQITQDPTHPSQLLGDILR